MGGAVQEFLGLLLSQLMDRLKHTPVVIPEESDFQPKLHHLLCRES